MQGCRWWACALALAAAAPARAGEEPAGGATLRWADVVASLDRDPRLRSARALAASAAGAVSAAATPPNPELEAELGRGESREGPARRDEWGLSVSIPLEWLARRGPALEAARAGLEAQREESRALRGEVAAELWRLFVTAGYAQDEVAALEATRGQAEALAGLVRRRVEAGEGRPVELPRVEVELELVEGELDGAAAERDAALAQLGVWLGAPVRRVALGEGPVAEGTPDLARHPRARAALARAAAAAAEASVARRSRLPALAVGGFYASELDRVAYGGRVTVELPLWSWRSGEVVRAEAAAGAEARRAEAERRSLEAGLAEARLTCARARAMAERQRTRILPRAEASARTLERTFQLGEAGLLEVIDARRVLQQARREALTSARERDLRCGALDLLSGPESP